MNNLQVFVKERGAQKNDQKNSSWQPQDVVAPINGFRTKKRFRRGAIFFHKITHENDRQIKESVAVNRSNSSVVVRVFGRTAGQSRVFLSGTPSYDSVRAESLSSLLHESSLTALRLSRVAPAGDANISHELDKLANSYWSQQKTRIVKAAPRKK